jgi:hypothetical protein
MFACLADCQAALEAAGTHWDLESKLTSGQDVEWLAAALMSSNDSALTSLSVENNSLGDPDVVQLGRALCAQHVRLMKLNAAGNAIGAAGVTGLVSPTLNTLVLATNALGDAGAQAMAIQLNESALTVLDLQKNGIGELGGCALGHALLVRCAWVG